MARDADDQPPAPRGQGLRMLVVDDVDEIRDILTLAMELCPHGAWTIATEGDPGRALERVKEEPFDLVLSDFRMGAVDGLQVLAAAAKTHPEGRRVLMTGFNEIPADDTRLDDAAPHAHLPKPFAMDALFELIDRMTGASREELERMRAQTYRELAATRLPSRSPRSASA